MKKPYEQSHHKYAAHHAARNALAKTIIPEWTPPE
jgi:hypothetical protein